MPVSTGAPEGHIVPFVFANGTGWVGFFCIRAPHRGKGYGRALFNALMAHYLQAGTRIVGLDAVPEQKGTYERRGFVATDLIRVVGRPGLKEAPLPRDERAESALKESERLVDLKDVPVEALVRSELEHTGFERPRLWSKDAMFSRPDAFGLALVDKEDASKLRGWILVRRCQEGRRFGPVYAESAGYASLLLRKAMERTEGEEGTLTAEAWPSNAESIGVFEGLGWKVPGVDYFRMWLGGKVPEQQQKGGKAERCMFAIFDAAEG